VLDYGYDDYEDTPAAAHAAEAEAMRGLSLEQVDGAREWLRQDPLRWVRLPWDTLTEAVGALHPGAYWLVGAYTGAGKSTFLSNCLMDFAARGTRTYYLPLEQRPDMVRILWAGLACGYNPNHVAQLEWGRLPPNARTEVQAFLDWQESDRGRDIVFFDEVSTPTVGELRATIARAGRQGYQVMVIDHFNRMAQPRYQDTVDLAQALKEGAKEWGLALLVAGQLNRGDGRNPLRMYLPPTIEDVKQGNVIVEEADVALGLYRPLQATASKADLALVRAGMKDVAAFVEPNTVGVKVLKHRFGPNTGRTYRLTFKAGRISDPITEHRDTTEARYGL
jgi:replicative DNA helicase